MSVFTTVNKVKIKCSKGLQTRREHEVGMGWGMEGRGEGEEGTRGSG